MDIHSCINFNVRRLIAAGMRFVMAALLNATALNKGGVGLSVLSVFIGNIFVQRPYSIAVHDTHEYFW